MTKAVFGIKRHTQHFIVFNNGSRIISLPARRGYGFTANLVVIDEFFKINKAKSGIHITDVINNVKPALDKRKGQIIFVGTADGMNVQRKMYFDAKNKVSSYKAMFFSCFDDPNMTQAKRERLVLDSPDGERSVNQEYPRTDVEAFLSSGSARFDVNFIEEHYRELVPTPIAVGDIEDQDSVVLNKNGYIEFYQKLKRYGQYLITADVAEGLAHGDYSVAKVFDIETWEQVACFHGHIEPSLFGSYLAVMGRHWNNAIIIPEHNKDGATVIATLRRMELYPDELLFQGNHVKEAGDDEYKHPEKRYGWLTTARTKPIIINNLAKSIKSNDVPYFTQRDIDEMYTYIRLANGRTGADEGCFDDSVIALGIGYYLLPAYPYDFEAQQSECATCSHYDSQDKICSLTKRTIKNKEGAWCHKYQEDLSDFDSTISTKKLKYSGIKKT